MRIQEREHYLKQLGLRAWFARKRLSGAKPSPEYQLAPQTFSKDEMPRAATDLLSAQVSASESPHFVQSSGPSIPETSESVYSQTRGNGAPFNDFSPQMSAKHEPPQASMNEPVSPAEFLQGKQLSTDTSVRWQVFVRAYRLQNTLIVCESDAQQPFALEQRLLKNILYTFMGKITTPEMLGCFSWPVFRDTTLAGLEAEKGLELFSRWLAQYVVPELEHVLFLGADKALQKEVKAMSFARLDCFSVSLSDCLTEPSKKRILWSEIKMVPQLIGSSE